MLIGCLWPGGILITPNYDRGRNAHVLGEHHLPWGSERRVCARDPRGLSLDPGEVAVGLGLERGPNGP